MTLHNCDVMDGLARLADRSVNCCVTSPPYYGLRDYNHDGQIGLEPTPDAYVAKMVEVFREVRRVLRDDGTLWLNLGDSYAGSWGNYSGQNRGNGTQREIVTGSAAPNPAYDGLHQWRPPASRKLDGIKPKDLIGIPWRVAFALQADGWYLRQDIIWHKPNPMPESVRDRCTKAHEYLFLLSKSERYWFDSEEMREPAQFGEQHAKKSTSWGTNRKHPNKANCAKYAFVGDNHTCHKDDDGNYTRNRRSVWSIPTQPYSGAHFAVMPEALVKPCILAGSPLDGTVLDPFAGSGTVLACARWLGRRHVGIELNPSYCELIRARLAERAHLFEDASTQ